MGRLTDILYYTSFRIFAIFRDKLEPTQSFNATKIRDIRNRLVEHPEVLSQSLSIGGTNGPCIKVARTVDFASHKTPDTEIFQDEGVYVNFNEFLNNLNKRLDF